MPSMMLNPAALLFPADDRPRSLNRAHSDHKSQTKPVPGAAIGPGVFLSGDVARLHFMLRSSGLPIPPYRYCPAPTANRGPASSLDLASSHCVDSAITVLSSGELQKTCLQTNFILQRYRYRRHCSTQEACCKFHTFSRCFYNTVDASHSIDC